MLMKCKSEEYARLFIQAVRRTVPNLIIDWQGIMDEFVARDDMHFTLFLHLSLFRVIVEASVSRCDNCVSTEHHHEICSRIGEISGFSFPSSRMPGYFREIRTMVIQFTQEYHEFLMNASTLLELALWKVMSNEGSFPKHHNIMNNRTIREDMRVKSGQIFQVVIPNVLLFL